MDAWFCGGWMAYRYGVYGREGCPQQLPDIGVARTVARSFSVRTER